MGALHRRIAHDLGNDETKAPAYELHLPSGDVFNVKTIGAEGPLVRFTGFWASATTVDYVLMAPEAVVVHIRTVVVDDESFEPIDFEDED